MENQQLSEELERQAAYFEEEIAELKKQLSEKDNEITDLNDKIHALYNDKQSMIDTFRQMYTSIDTELHAASRELDIFAK